MNNEEEKGKFMEVANLPDAIRYELQGVIPRIEAYRIDAELASNFKDLKIGGVEDAENYKAADAARKKVRHHRLELQKIGKSTVEYLDAVKKIVRNQVIEIADIYSETEGALKSEISRVDNEKQLIKEAEERIALEAFNRRVELLFAAGFRYDGLNYVAGALIVSPYDIQESDDSLFHDMVKQGEQFIAEQAEREARREEELAILKETEKRHQAEQKRQELERSFLAAEAARIEEMKLAIAKEKQDIQEEQRRAEADSDKFEREKERIYRETSIAARAETTKQMQSEIDAKRVRLEELQARSVKEVRDIWGGENAGNALPPGFLVGFQAAKNILLREFKISAKGGGKRTMSQWREFIADLQPETGESNSGK